VIAGPCPKRFTEDSSRSAAAVAGMAYHPASGRGTLGDNRSASWGASWLLLPPSNYKAGHGSAVTFISCAKSGFPGPISLAVAGGLTPLVRAGYSAAEFRRKTFSALAALGGVAWHDRGSSVLAFSRRSPLQCQHTSLTVWGCRVQGSRRGARIQRRNRALTRGTTLLRRTQTEPAPGCPEALAMDHPNSVEVLSKLRGIKTARQTPSNDEMNSNAQSRVSPAPRVESYTNLFQ